MNEGRKGTRTARTAVLAPFWGDHVAGSRILAVATLALVAALVAALGFIVPKASAATQVVAARGLTIDVWINKEEGGVFASGEKMQVFFRANTDAYVLLYNIDTEGYIHLIYPFRPNDPMRVEGGETYRVPSRHDPYDLVAEGPEGMEYVVAVASPFPFGDLPWYLAPGATTDSRRYDDEGEDEDDLDRGVVVGDPYVGMARIMERIVPGGREDRVATANTYFYIQRRVEYPRYVCADCHHRNYWFDPYSDYCSVVEIRIDATWYRYAPIRYRTARPRYYYRVRSTAPTRYRAWKEQWSSLDGNKTLRQRFVLERETQHQRTRDQRQDVPDKGLRRYRSNRDRPDRMWHGRDQVIPLRERERNNEGRDQREQRDRGQDRRREIPDRTPDRREGPRGERRDSREERRPDERRDDGRRNQDRRQQQEEERRNQREGEERRREERRQEQQREERPRDDRRRDDSQNEDRRRGDSQRDERRPDDRQSQNDWGRGHRGR